LEQGNNEIIPNRVTIMDLKSLTQIYIPAIETELQKQVARLDRPHTRHFHEMLTYHMGWTGEGAGPEATGKRIRPLMVLLATAATGGKWEHALPCGAHRWRSMLETHCLSLQIKQL
jgi:geranylgeranyl pyrophosphate synthase